MALLLGDDDNVNKMAACPISAAPTLCSYMTFYLLAFFLQSIISNCVLYDLELVLNLKIASNITNKTWLKLLFL
jgi:hypothetical protein